MFRNIAKQVKISWINYIWFIKISQSYMGNKNAKWHYTTKIFLQSLHKGLFFCYQIFMDDYEMKKNDKEYYNKLIEDKNVIIKFLIEKNHIEKPEEYDDFINMLKVMQKLE